MHYQPIGDIWLTCTGHSQPTDRQRQLATDHAITVPKSVSDSLRQLDMDQAIVTVKYRLDGVAFTREVFISPVDQVVVIRLTADHAAKLSFTAALVAGGPEQRDGDAQYDAELPNEIVVRGRAMSDQSIEGQVRYQIRARFLT